ncbi:TRAP transporter small permease subunit [Desulfomonile tiedjei]|uniref:TRAP-type mannitol/chloroaromatic compound transport system, small permease component n=1 Tax=Desulfomonile tiedjei (strain ATCC 49306 / DSM 6799 / DCB-1) TaxID=706587 RepID=I4C0Q5_DESTA|nr:TRAP transporter small permease [Desulfomonile tiedjei]AFM23146.1 TRAP-type mannitol/chloroaromatic compound transport system, small permease component [Desulfomonile tiedjei DSM 6799]
MYTRIRDVIQTATRVLGYVGMVFIFPMMLLTSADATYRDLFSRTIPGAFELSSLMLSILVLLGLAYAQQMRDHVRVTFLVERLPEKLGTIVTIITTLMSMSIVAILCWQGVVLSLENTQVSDMLRIPQWPFRMLVAVGAFFLLLEFFFDLVDSVRRLAE